MSGKDELGVWGTAIASLGSILGMFGIFRQANAYYPFELSRFFKHLLLVSKALVSLDWRLARKQIQVAAELGGKRGEDRTLSLIGLYCVFSGFLLQFVGSLLLLGAFFV